MAAREAAERGRGMGHVRSPAQLTMTRSGSGCPLSPRATAVIAGVLAGRGGLLPERTGDDGAGGVGGDGAGGPAPCRLAGCRCEGYRFGNWPLSRATGPATMLFIATVCLETL